MLQKDIYTNVPIVDINIDGGAIGKIDNIVIFIPSFQDVVPGDIVDVKIVKKKKNFLEGKVITFKKQSEHRTTPFCKHFGVCGGCKLQNLSYEAQLFYKQKQVVDSFQRIAKAKVENILPILGAKNTIYYRNKLEFAFCSNRWLSRENYELAEVQVLKNHDKPNSFRHIGINMNGLGFYVSGLFDRVVDIEHCYLQKDPSNAIRLAIKNYALKNNLSFYNQKTHEGFLRNLIIRTSTTNDVMVVVCFSYDDEKKRHDLLQFVADSFPQINSLMFVINPKKNETIYDLKVESFGEGRDYIFEKIESMTYKISPKSFFQTNTEQSVEMYKIISSFAQLTGTEIVYDLYTGVGTIANFIAPNAKKVIGIENVLSAVEDAKINSEINSHRNTVFYCGDVENILNENFFEQNGNPDVIIIDPPRAGMHKKVIKKILNSENKRIIYVSCNPSTQARDIAILGEKYDVVKMQPIDMFPHTSHVENVALMVKK